MVNMAKVKPTLVKAGGVATGMVVGEFPAETTARAAGLAGWPKVGAKALVKAIVGAAMFYGADKARGEVAEFLEYGGAGAVGGIFLDVIHQLLPGGVQGAAEQAALKVRSFFLGRPAKVVAVPPASTPERKAAEGPILT